MAKIPIEIGDKIELNHIQSASNRALSENTYRSQLLDFDGLRVAKISMPMFEGRVIPLEIDDEYDLVFFSKKGMYQCSARVQNRYAENKIYVIELLFISPLKRFQRREYYRLECMLPVAFVYKKEDGNVTERFDGTLFDLSGGGLRFRCNTEVPTDILIQLVVPLSFEEGVQACRVEVKVSECKVIDQARNIYEVRGSFENLSEAEREHIIRFVFEEQRRRMRKE